MPTRDNAHDKTQSSIVPLLLCAWHDRRAPVRPVTPDLVEPRVVLEPFEEASRDDNRDVGHHGAHDGLFEQHTDHVCEAQCGRPAELQETGAEDEGEEPEDCDHHHIEDGNHDEEDDVNWQAELEVVDQVEVRQSLIVDLEVVDGLVTRLVLNILREED